MSLVDLHLHSTFSDGVYTPAQLVEQAAAARLTVVALTDHDTLNGIPEFFAAGKLTTAIAEQQRERKNPAQQGTSRRGEVYNCPHKAKLASR